MEKSLESKEIEQNDTEMQELRDATSEFVDLLSEICSKYGIEQADIDAMNSGLENVWNSVTMAEDEIEIEVPEEIDDEMEAAEELQLEMEEVDEEE